MELEWRDANELKSALLLAGVGQNTTIKYEKIKQFIFYSSSTCGRLLYMGFGAKLGQRLCMRKAYVLWLMNWELGYNLPLQRGHVCIKTRIKSMWETTFQAISFSDVLWQGI